MSRNGYSLVSCDAGSYLGNKIDECLRGNDGYLGQLRYEEHIFDNDEVKPILLDPVRGTDLFVVQCVYAPMLTGRNLNTNLMALALTIQEARLADAESVTAIVPFLPYSRQERRSGKEVGRREPLSAQYVLGMLELAGAKRVIPVNVHAEAVEGQSRLLFDNIYTTNLMISRLKSQFPQYLENAVVSSLDLGGMKTTGIYSRRLGLPAVVVYKEKDEETGEMKEDKMMVIGDVRGKIVITIDDIAASVRTFRSGAKKLIAEGAEGIIACFTHPFFTGHALEYIEELTSTGKLLGVIGTNSIPRPGFEDTHPWYHEIDLAPTLAEVIKAIENGESLHKILD